MLNDPSASDRVIHTVQGNWLTQHTEPTPDPPPSPEADAKSSPDTQESGTGATSGATRRHRDLETAPLPVLLRFLAAALEVEAALWSVSDIQIAQRRARQIADDLDRSSKRQLWTDEPLSIGTEGFIVETSHTMKGWERYELRDRPASTNMSHVPQLTGWCGTTNDVSVHAFGLGKVVSVARNGRCRIEPVSDPQDIRRILEELGYPDLVPEEES